MPKKCIVCGKTGRSGFNVSHSHHRTKRRFNANLKKIKIVLNGQKKKAYVCTDCISAGKISKPA